MRRLLLLLTVVVAAVGVAPATRASGHAAEMRNNSFNPPDMTVAVGDSVAWHNYDAETHSVVGGPVNSPDVAPGAEFIWTFSSPGDVSYTCRFHPYMTGVVHVGAAAAAAPTPAPAAAPPVAGPSPTTTPTTAAAATSSTALPPAARMAIASPPATGPELVADSTTTSPSISATTAPTATPVPKAAIESAASSSGGNTGLWLLLVAVALALAGWFGVRALRKDLKS